MTKRKDKDELGEKMEKLACAMADSLLSENLDDAAQKVSKARTDGFKALSGYFSATRKLDLKTQPDEDEGAFNFGNSRNKINGEHPKTSQ